MLWPSDENGWDHPPLLLPTPILILRVNRQGTRVETPEGEIIASHDDCIVTPYKWIDEIFKCLVESAKGTARKLFLRPACPVAIVGASYEFGRHINPHENCFPHADRNEVDELFVAFHATGFALMNGRWSLVGRPASRLASWRGWTIPDRLTDWPRPPMMMPDKPKSATRSPLDPIQLPGVEPKPCMSFEEYSTAIDKIKAHLAAGDIYQANMTVRFEGQTSASAERIFAAGLQEGGERYGAFVRGVGCSHVSFSPELLVRKWGRTIVTKPIKGTRPRGDKASTQMTALALASSTKDRAEHVMIVDLERNDLGRLCEYGSIRVDPLMEITTHPTVLHMESTVTGTLRSHVTWREILVSLFPGGSVTGAPKRRSMEIIGEIEQHPRGIYCGALGWIDARGDCEFNLPIRTATVFNDRRIHLYSGGGIVADSTAINEWKELHHKLKFMQMALKKAQ